MSAAPAPPQHLDNHQHRRDGDFPAIRHFHRNLRPDRSYRRQRHGAGHRRVFRQRYRRRHRNSARLRIIRHPKGHLPFACRSLITDRTGWISHRQVDGRKSHHPQQNRAPRAIRRGVFKTSKGNVMPVVECLLTAEAERCFHSQGQTTLSFDVGPDGGEPSVHAWHRIKGCRNQHGEGFGQRPT